MTKSKIPTEEQILAAAKASPEAKKALAKLFPDLFKPKEFNIKALARKGSCSLFTSAQAKAAGFRDSTFMEVRDWGKYENKGFYLDAAYDWRLDVDDSGMTVLIPTKQPVAK